MSSSFRKVTAVLAGFAGVYLAACTFGLDGLSGGVPDSGVLPDGAIADVTTSPTDGTTTSPSDGGDATVSVNCPGHPDAIFCDSFGGVTTMPVWIPDEGNGGGVQNADASLVTTIPVGGTNGTIAEANITAEFPFPTGVFRTYVDIYLDSESNRGAYLDLITLKNGAESYDIQLFGRNDTTKIEADEHLDDGGEATVNTPIPGYATLPLRTWMRVIFEVDYSNPTAASYTFSLENPRDTAATVLVGPTAINWPYVPTSIVVAVGDIDVNQPTTVPWRVLYQNFALTKP